MNHPSLLDLWRLSSPWPAAWQAAHGPRPGDLLPHQELSAQVVTHALRHLPGFLLASPVGAGKTRIALRVADLLDLTPAVICPAALRPMWEQALDGRGEVYSYDALLRRTPPERALWICDEAHEIRNPETLRHQAVAALPASTRLLLLSATPVQNATTDLAALLHLFVSDAVALEIAGRPLLALLQDSDPTRLHLLLERVALRLSQEQVEGLLVAPTLPVRRRHHETLLLDRPDEADLLLVEKAATAAALNTSERPLLQETLLRRMLSSHEALATSLARLERFLRRAAEASAAGGSINRRTFARTFAEEREGGPAQLYFPFWYQRTDQTLPPPADLLERADELAALRQQALQSDYGARSAVAALRDTLAQARLTVAFTDHLDTAQAAERAFRATAKTALWTGTGLRSRHLPVDAPADALASLRRSVERGEGPWCLLATPVGAQGHNLQFAEQLFHLDLPWNPARVEQREGRLDRPGGQADIRITTLLPPPAVEARLRLLARLARKETTAAATALPVRPLDLSDPWSPLLTLAAQPPAPPVAAANACDPAETFLLAARPTGLWLRRPGKVWQPLTSHQLLRLAAAPLHPTPAAEADALAPRAERWLALLHAETAALRRLAARPLAVRRRREARANWDDAARWADAGLPDEGRARLSTFSRWSGGEVPAGRRNAPAADSASEQDAPLPHRWFSAACSLLDTLLAERSPPS